jgi:hypothetical protein
MHSPDRSSQRSEIPLRVLAVPLALAVLMGALVGALPWHSHAFVGALLVFLLSLALVLPVLYIIVKKENLAQPVVVFSAVAFGYVTSAVFLLSGRQSVTLGYRLGSHNMQYFVEALLYAFLGVVSFQFAYFAARRTRTSNNLDRYRIAESRQVPRGKLTVAILSLSLVGLLGYLLIMSESGGFSFLTSNIIVRAQLIGSNYFRVMLQFLQVAGWVWYVYDPKASRKPLFWLLIGLNLLLLGSLGSRSSVILFILSLLILRLLRSSKNPIPSLARFVGRFWQIAIVAVLVISVFFGFLAWRRASLAIRVSGGELELSDVVVQLSTFFEKERLMATLFGQANVAGMEMLSTIVEAVPEKLPLMHGRTLLWAVLSPVPRALWPDKPVNTGLYLNRILSNPNTITGIPPSWIGELFLNFNVAGVILGCGLLGLFSAIIYNAFLKNRSRPIAHLLYCAYLVYFLPHLIRTEFKIPLNRLVFYVIAILLAYAIVRPGKARNQPSAIPNQR